MSALASSPFPVSVAQPVILLECEGGGLHSATFRRLLPNETTGLNTCASKGFGG